ncbi:hypothetical protein DL98DRAFT_659606 [Cadophora sp. DSE1049]|nr:hypothetical protein DL98DRAFT_659606 [Cadophora sp. DSE1049]
MSSSTSRFKVISKHQVEQLHNFNVYHSVISYADGDPRPSAEHVASLVASVYAEKSSVTPSCSQEEICEAIRGLLDEGHLDTRSALRAFVDSLTHTSENDEDFSPKRFNYLEEDRAEQLPVLPNENQDSISFGGLKEHALKRPTPLTGYDDNRFNNTYLPFRLQQQIIRFLVSTVEECCFYFVKKWRQDWLDKENIRTPASRKIKDRWDILQTLQFPRQAVAGASDYSILFSRAKNIRSGYIHRAPATKVFTLELALQGVAEICSLLRDNHLFLKMNNLLHEFLPIASRGREGVRFVGTNHTPIPWETLQPLSDMFGVSKSDCESEGYWPTWVFVEP